MDRVNAIAAILLVFNSAGGCSSPCSSTERTLLRDTTGLVFTAVDTSCDSIAKDETVSIYVADGTARSLLMKYDPDPRSGGPQITIDGNNIAISVDSVAELISQTERFQSYKVAPSRICQASGTGLSTRSCKYGVALRQARVCQSAGSKRESRPPSVSG